MLDTLAECDTRQRQATEPRERDIADGPRCPSPSSPPPSTPAPPPSSQPGPPGGDRALVAVFASAVSGYLLRYAADAGYRCLLVDPDPVRAPAAKARGVGIMGNPHHAGPHVEALNALGVAPGDIARVRRPIGLNIGSRTPPEIAISTLAGLLADRNSRPGGFSF